MDNALREFFETARKQAEKIAEAVLKAEEALAETLLPLIEQMAEALAEIIPLAIVDVRRRAAYTPTKKDAPKKLGAERTAKPYARRKFCARSRI